MSAVNTSALNRPNLGSDLADRLDENYLFLLNFVESSMTSLTPEQQALSKKWLIKLGTEANSESVEGKLKRNAYLGKLITCMQDVHFAGIFATPPPSGPLPAEQWKVPHYTETPVWLDGLVERQANRINVGGKNFETYVSTKMFEDGRGACAYVAVSVKNEGDRSAWKKIHPNEHKKIHEMYKREIGKSLNMKGG